MANEIPLSRKSIEPPRITMGEGKSPRGRKSLLMKRSVLIRLWDALEAGNTYNNACALAGLGRTTFYRWMDESKTAPEGHPLRDFRDTIKRACAIAENRHVLIIQKAAVHHWQAAAWWLERRCPQHYGRRRIIAVGGNSDAPSPQPSKILVRLPTEKEILAKRAAILKRCGHTVKAKALYAPTGITEHECN